jgi:cobalamin-dependent methionine synthase I
MMIIGEKLNTSIPKTQTAVAARDLEYLTGLIHSQVECGADFLDINTAVGVDNELESLTWLVNLVMEHSKVGIMLDSPSPEVISNVIGIIKDRPVIVNSVTLADRLELLPVIRDTGARVVGLPIDEDGIPDSAARRCDNAARLIEKITQSGIPAEKILIDVLAESLAIADQNLMTVLQTIPLVKKMNPEVKTVCGVSNVSFGLPQRININCAFLVAAAAAGLDAAILDITSPTVKTCLISSLAVAGKDEYCLRYISHIRQQKK